mgnify:FL=1
MTLYIVWRYVLIVMILAAGFLFGRRMKQKQDQRAMRAVSITTFALIVLVGVSFYFPLENLFVRFSTAEEAVGYMYGEDIVLSDEGEDSCGMFLQKNKNEATYSWVCIPKDERGYKLPPMIGGITNEKETRSKDGSMQMTIYNVKNSKDTYVTITTALNRQVQTAENNINTPVYGTGAELGDTGYVYYIFLSYTQNEPLPYTLYLDGEEAAVFE